MELLGIVCREHLGRRTRKHHAPAVEHGHEVCPRGVLHGVRDLDERGASGVEVTEDAPQVAAATGVKSRGGLVQHEKVRLHGEDARKRAKALLAPRKLERRGVVFARKAHECERLLYAPLDLTGRKTQVGGPVRHVCRDGLGKELPLRALHHVTHAAMKLAPVLAVGRGEAIHLNAPLVRHLEGGNKPQQRRLSRARLPHERNVRAARHLERHAIECGGRGISASASAAGLLVGKVHVLRENHGCCGGVGRRSCGGTHLPAAVAARPSRQLVEEDVLVAGPGNVHAALLQLR